MAFGFMRTFFPETKKRRKNAAATRKAIANKQREENIKELNQLVAENNIKQLFKTSSAKPADRKLLQAFANSNNLAARQKSLSNLFESQRAKKPNKKLLKAFAAANGVAINNTNNNTNLTEEEIEEAKKKLENSFKKSGIPSKLNVTRSRQRKLPRNVLNMYGL
jgi:hypothetical protein